MANIFSYPMIKFDMSLKQFQKPIIGQKTCINSNDLFRDSLKTVKIMFETKATILRSSKHFE
jgi:hypothetical protein